MFSLPGFSIGDSWFVVSDGVAHGFFCTSPEPRPSWNWDIGHAVSRDLVHWDFLGFALERGGGESWDSQTLSTGSVLAWKGRFWMAYSALRRNENPPTRKVHRVGLAVSDDLYSWTKCESNPVNERDPGLYERLGPVHKAFGQWRDPFLFEVDDRVFQLVCARSKHPDRGRRGAVGLATSPDMRAWQVRAPLDVDPIATEIEVPQVYRIDGRYFLLFCTSADRIVPWFRRRFPSHAFRNADFSMVSASPLGPFRIHGTGEVLPPDAPVQPYASRLIMWQGQWVMLGTATVDGTRCICDPIPVVATETGIRAA
ncbi:MAG: hypothetical protein OXG43_01505 [Chloroflexi bacterium]|nr:hypothetical protein [Chloroflexota bacterium]